MKAEKFTTVLGRPRLLTADALFDARRRVLAYDGDVVVGVATYEPLFGQQAEAAIAVVPDSTGSIVSYLLDSLTELAAASGVTVLRFAFGMPGQRRVASGLSAAQGACSLRPDRLEIRTHAADRRPSCRLQDGVR